MKANPVRNPIHPRHPLEKRYDRIPSPFSLISKFRNIKTMPILIILGLLMGGSASFAAENAVPGDVLFPVKIYVNENVRGAVAVTSQAKAQWEVNLVERRLEEIERLAVLPDVNPDIKEIAQGNLEKYTERAKERISNFENEDDDEDAILTTEKLTKVLRAHEAILSTLDEDSINYEGVFDNVTLATTTVGVINATSTTGTINKENLSSLKEALKTLHEVREYSEKKNKEIEHKRSSKREEKRMTNPDFNDVRGEIKNEKQENGDDNEQEETHLDNISSTTTIDIAPRKIESDTDSSKEDKSHPLETVEKERH